MNMNKKLQWHFRRPTEDGVLIDEYSCDILTLFDLRLRFIIKEVSRKLRVQLYVEQTFADSAVLSKMGEYESVEEAQDGAAEEYVAIINNLKKQLSDGRK